jgi:hypothetical protein
MEPYNNGALQQWSLTTMEPYNNGALQQWSLTTMEPYSSIETGWDHPNIGRNTLNTLFRPRTISLCHDVCDTLMSRFSALACGGAGLDLAGLAGLDTSLQASFLYDGVVVYLNPKPETLNLIQGEH